MTNRITVLSETVINRIAAGEVVERPVSVVKELVENSIDADATSVQVDIEAGGRKLIRVRDDGTGMSRDDAFLALERHATSKLRTEQDLVGVATMGFRGEALASIASVSRLRLLTSDGLDPAGTEVVIEGGVLRKSEYVGLGRGTVVEVRNLFFNVTVRRKFLKAHATEAGHIHEFITKLALAFPGIAFMYRENGKLKVDAPRVNSTLERVHTLYSRDVRDNLMDVEFSSGDARLYGYVARPPYGRSTMRSVQTFVNGRPVRDKLINGAITRALSNLMERGRYPLAVLFLELPPEQVDVNVHPQKAEVRFVNPQQIFNVILDGVHQALTGAPFNPPPGPRERILPERPTTPVARHVQDRRPPVQTDSAQSRAPAPAPPPTSEPPPPEPARGESPRGLEEPSNRFSSLTFLGALPGSFVVLHSENELIVMDHHAAHERVLFEDLKQCDRTGGGFETQDLLIPQVLEFSVREARALALHLDLLKNAGFRVEEFGEKDFVVKGVPVWLGTVDLEEFFEALVEVMLDTGVKGDPHRGREEVLKNMACRAAVKETKAMHPEEMRALLRDLDRVGSIDVCPHGRPITVRYPLSEIRRKMGRR
ncbi:MAG: DNA mismatch repair endonuclease MutL [Deltaproteobacteria bacterium]